MTTRKPILAILFGVVLAVAVETVLAIVLVFPWSLQELGSFIMLMFLICVWGCTPSLLLPFVIRSVTTRAEPRRIIRVFFVLGAVSPFLLGAVLYLVMSLSNSLIPVAVALLSAAFVIGTALSRVMLPKRQDRSRHAESP